MLLACAAVLTVMTRDDPAFVAPVVGLLASVIAWQYLPHAPRQLLFGASVPALAFLVSSTWLVQNRAGVPDELVVLTVALGTCRSDGAGLFILVFLASAWQVYVHLAGDAGSGGFPLLCAVAVGRVCVDMQRATTLARARTTRANEAVGAELRAAALAELEDAVWPRDGYAHTVDRAIVCVVYSAMLAERAWDGAGEELGVWLERMQVWAAQWSGRVVGLHGLAVVLVCDGSVRDAVDMTAFIMDHVTVCAGAVDVVSLRLWSHGERMFLGAEALRRATDSLVLGELRVGPGVQDVLNYSSPTVFASPTGAPPEPVQPPAAPEPEHVLARGPLVPVVEHRAPSLWAAWLAPTPPAWLLVAVAVLAWHGDPVAATVAAVFGCGALGAFWFAQHDVAYGYVIAVVHAWALVNPHTTFAGVAALALVPSAPAAAVTLAFWFFTMPFTLNGPIVAAIVAFGLWTTLTREHALDAVWKGHAALATANTRAGARHANLWDAYVPECLHRPPGALNGWTVLRDLGDRVVAYSSAPNNQCMSFPSLTGGWWLVSPMPLPADVDGALAEMRALVCDGTPVELARVSLFGYGGSVLVTAVLGSRTATPWPLPNRLHRRSGS